MASAFLSQALRQQAAQEARGQMMKDAIARQVSNQIMGQIAQSEINADMRRILGSGRALEQAAGQEMRRDIGRTQLEMQRKQVADAKKAALVGAAADSVGALLAVLGESEQEEFELEAPDTVLKARVPRNPESFDLDPNFNPTTAQIMGADVAKDLDVSAPALPDEFGQFVSPDTTLSLSGGMGTAEEALTREILRRRKNKNRMMGGM